MCPSGGWPFAARWWLPPQAWTTCVDFFWPSVSATLRHCLRLSLVVAAQFASRCDRASVLRSLEKVEWLREAFFFSLVTVLLAIWAQVELMSQVLRASGTAIEGLHDLCHWREDEDRQGTLIQRFIGLFANPHRLALGPQQGDMLGTLGDLLVQGIFQDRMNVSQFLKKCPRFFNGEQKLTVLIGHAHTWSLYLTSVIKLVKVSVVLLSWHREM